MIGYLKSTSIEAICAVVPEQYDSLDNYADIWGEKRINRHKKTTGISGRFVSDNKQKSSDLAIEAAKAVLDRLSWEADEIKALIFVTQSSPMRLPSTAFFIQKTLGISRDCIVFDINLGCTGNNVGLQVLSGLLNQMEEGAKGLLLYSDAVHAVAKEETTTDSLLFGSAGTAMAVMKKEGKDIPILNYSDGDRYTAIKCMHGGQTDMNGEAVFSFGINDVAKDLVEFKKHFQIEEELIDFYSIHQAQKMMLDTICELAEIPEEKEIRSMDRYANTNRSSVLVNLCANRDILPDKDYVNGIICGFGVGLSWCMEYISIKRDCILEIRNSSAIYEL